MKTILTLTAAIAAAGLTSTGTSAAPLPGIASPMITEQNDPLVQKAHYFHFACRLDRGGWHRYNKLGERIPCGPLAPRRWL